MEKSGAHKAAIEDINVCCDMLYSNVKGLRNRRLRRHE